MSISTRSLRGFAVVLCLLFTAACSGATEPVAATSPGDSAAPADTGDGDADTTDQPTDAASDPAESATAGPDSTDQPTASDSEAAAAGEAIDLAEFGGCEVFPIADLEVAVGAAPLTVRASTFDQEYDSLVCEWDVAAADNTSEPGVFTRVGLFVGPLATTISGAPRDASVWLAQLREGLVGSNGVPESELTDVAGLGKAALFCCNSDSEELVFVQALTVYSGQRDWNVSASKTDANGTWAPVDQTGLEAVARAILTHADA